MAPPGSPRSDAPRTFCRVGGAPISCARTAVRTRAAPQRAREAATAPPTRCRYAGGRPLPSTREERAGDRTQLTDNASRLSSWGLPRPQRTAGVRTRPAGQHGTLLRALARKTPATISTRLRNDTDGPMAGAGLLFQVKPLSSAGRRYPRSAGRRRHASETARGIPQQRRGHGGDYTRALPSSGGNAPCGAGSSSSHGIGRSCGSRGKERLMRAIRTWRPPDRCLTPRSAYPGAPRSSLWRPHPLGEPEQTRCHRCRPCVLRVAA